MACELFFFVALISIAEGTLFWVAIAMVAPTLLLTWWSVPGTAGTGTSLSSQLSKTNSQQIDLRALDQNTSEEASRQFAELNNRLRSIYDHPYICAYYINDISYRLECSKYI